MNYFNFYCSFLHMISQLQWQRCRYAETYSFGGPWVRIQARTENMSVIFFCADFSTFSYLKLASDSFGGVHEQYGPKRGKGRFFYLVYERTQLIVPYLCSQNGGGGKCVRIIYRQRQENQNNLVFLISKEQPVTNGLSEYVVVTEKKLLHFCYCTFPQILLQ